MKRERDEETKRKRRTSEKRERENFLKRGCSFFFREIFFFIFPSDDTGDN